MDGLSNLKNTLRSHDPEIVRAKEIMAKVLEREEQERLKQEVGEVKGDRERQGMVPQLARQEKGKEQVTRAGGCLAEPAVTAEQINRLMDRINYTSQVKDRYGLFEHSKRVEPVVASDFNVHLKDLNCVRKSTWLDRAAGAPLYLLASLTSSTAYADEFPPTGEEASSSSSTVVQPSWAERWSKARQEVEATEEYKVPGGEELGNLVVGVGYGVGAEVYNIAKTTGKAVVKLGLFASKLEQAYLPEHEEDVFTAHNQDLRQEIDLTMERGFTGLERVVREPGLIGRAIVDGVTSSVIERSRDIARKYNEGDWFGIGEGVGSLGFDAANTLFAVKEVANLGFRALDLALDPVFNTAKMLAPTESLVMFQYQLQQRVTAVGVKQANEVARLTRKAAQKVSSSKSMVTSQQQATSSSNATNINSQAALNKKFRALEDAQREAVKIQELPDGRVRYYEQERSAKIPGPTRGASRVTEYNPKTGQMRAWDESHDHAGNVTRVHPKMIDGEVAQGQHYPPTKAELESFTSKPRGPQ